MVGLRFEIGVFIVKILGDGYDNDAGGALLTVMTISNVVLPLAFAAVTV